ncbi:hypothetical protein SAMN06265795_1286 [Noviherbaspirillum humi]|uniref:Uncharacterized protein n=1 Tax=Noviherbaspirillum humi TaxID=1688639 RepID=A0A239LXT7_9BURK|nr:hypothetical protein [Noviherbaspirillum humi]SNT35271.1 hypothetical protein SAMN06265795_1286 [Noviherbaspirillum humi]
MAKNVKNKYPADKTGTKYSEFRNTKRTPPGKTKAEKDAAAKQASTSATEQSAAQTA